MRRNKCYFFEELFKVEENALSIYSFFFFVYNIYLSILIYIARYIKKNKHDLVNEKKIEGISTIRDESDRNGKYANII